MRTPSLQILPLSLALLAPGLLSSLADDSSQTVEPGSPAEPIRILNAPEVDFRQHDGGLPPAVGTHNIQVLRANRTHPDAEGADGLGWTYNHAPMLCYWNDTFHLEYLTDPVGEHIPPGQTMLVESKDGYHWTRPRVLFPPFTPAGEENPTVSHQRMGFFVAPNGRLLALGFYGRAPRPNNGTGIGRAVREIGKDGTLGPIYFIRYNRHAGFNEDNTPYPFYKESEDEGFVAACDALLADKLMTQQWWEEDRSEDGFYAISGRDRGFDAKALSFYHRKDGTVVGLWKKRWAALSLDDGRSWTDPVQIPSLITGGAKIWGQRTDDDRYVLAYNPHPAHRWPLVVVSGDDGITFEGMRVAHGEIPYPRYDGQYKSMGPQYVRGIVEGNGNPPGEDLWLTYSVNKEDIWVSRIPLPIRGSETAPVNDDFDADPIGLPPTKWNVYSPLWAPVTITHAPGSDSGGVLRLQDKDRYDYAKAVRVFPAADAITLSLRVRPEAFSQGRLAIELLDHEGNRLVCLFINEEGLHRLRRPGDDIDRLQVQPTKEGEWLDLQVRADVNRQAFDVLVDGTLILANGDFLVDASGPLERLCLRTGPVRHYDAHAADLLIDESRLGDRLDGDTALTEAVFDIDDVRIAP